MAAAAVFQFNSEDTGKKTPKVIGTTVFKFKNRDERYYINTIVNVCVVENVSVIRFSFGMTKIEQRALHEAGDEPEDEVWAAVGDKGSPLGAPADKNYMACLVMDVPASAKTQILTQKNGRIASTIISLTRYDSATMAKEGGVFKGLKACMRPNIPEKTSFMKTWLAIAAEISRKLGCTHMNLEDAANVYTTQKDLWPLSQLTMLESGQTVYEKYGFRPLKNIEKSKLPIDSIFAELRQVRNKKLKDMRSKTDTEKILTELGIHFDGNETIASLWSEVKKKNGANGELLLDITYDFFRNLLPEGMLRVEKNDDGVDETHYYQNFKNIYSRDITNSINDLDFVEIRQFLAKVEKDQYEFLSKYETSKTDVYS